MKTMKYILLIICIACATTAMAVDYKVNSVFHGAEDYRYTHAQYEAALATAPQMVFRSTSTMPSSGSSLSIAAQDVIIDEGGNASIPSGPKRLPALPPDPFLDPLGDAVLPLLLLAAGYAICAWRKNKSHSRLATPESNNNNNE